MVADQSHVPQVTPAELKAELDAGQPVFIVDLRNREDAAQSRIEGRQPVPAVNLPYAEYVGAEDDLFDRLPRLPAGQSLTFICGKGGASEYFAALARERGVPARNLAGGVAAWGNFYEVRTVTSGTELTIFQVSRPARGCISYVIASAGEAVVVDPLRNIERYLELAAAGGFRIVAVLDTHGHADHISGGRALADRLGVPYYGTSAPCPERTATPDTPGPLTIMKEVCAMKSLAIALTVDARGLSCPMPVVRTKKAMDGLQPGEILELLATDKGSVKDVQAWARSGGHDVVAFGEQDGVFKF